jgi:hypothetical protein
MKLNVGASKKVGEANYGSRGASVNIEMELDSGLVAEPNKFREKIRQLFTLVRSSLAEELNGNGHTAQQSASSSTTTNSAQHDNSLPAQPANGSSNPPAQRSGAVRLASPAQVKALYGISRQKKVNLSDLLRQRCSVGRPDELTLAQASGLIDELRAMQEPG